MENEIRINRISAADNLLIDINPSHWRLLATDENGNQRGLLEAIPGRSLRYASSFAATRRLPGTGKLPLEYVWQVVLGWSQDDEAWHLGLLLARDLADARGSRWCELAYWPDPDANVFADMAQEAGQALAAILSRPFNYIPPRGKREAEVPLPELPLEIGMWRVERGDDEHLEIVRIGKWTRQGVMRILWYAILLVAYLVLSITTLNADLALPNAGTMLPNPELLPYLGLIVAGVLIVMIIYNLFEIIRQPNRIVIDGAEKRIAAQRGSSERWSINRDNFQSIYVTQVVSRKGNRTIHHGEINLHMGNGRFKQLFRQADEEEELYEPQHSNGDLSDEVMALRSHDVNSDLQAAGLHIAKTLGEDMPAWYDQRLR